MQIVEKPAELKLFEAHERMRQDLARAAAIQKSLLPHQSPLIRGLRVAWAFEPSEDLGGDILNIFLLDEKHVAFYVLDVTGHGIASSLLSVAASHFLSPYSDLSFARKNGNGIACPTEVVSRLSRQFGSNENFSQFFTILYGILDLDTYECGYVCAGHPPPVLLSGGKARVLEGGDLPVGVVSDAQYTARRVKLAKGDRLFIYSDGISEARNAEGQMYGESRFIDMLTASGDRPVNEVVDHVLGRVSLWTAPASPSDDISLLTLEIKR
jgi:phosphoserine phosphatase RsbU/P